MSLYGAMLLSLFYLIGCINLDSCFPVYMAHLLLLVLHYPRICPLHYFLRSMVDVSHSPLKVYIAAKLTLDWIKYRRASHHSFLILFSFIFSSSPILYVDARQPWRFRRISSEGAHALIIHDHTHKK